MSCKSVSSVQGYIVCKFRLLPPLSCQFNIEFFKMDPRGFATDPSDFSKNTMVEGTFTVFRYFLNHPASGTGIVELISYTRNIIGHDMSPQLVKFAFAAQNNLFGGYPEERDIVPSAIMVAMFSVLAIAHVLIFGVNYSRGHYFWMSPIWSFNCVLRVLGFAFRIVWVKDRPAVPFALTSELFLILPSIIIVTFNLILAQRIFTWRHPVGGSRRLFWGCMLTLYGVVLIVIGITIPAAFIQFLYFLSVRAYEQWKQVNMASSILIILYSLTSIALLGLAYFFQPTRKDEKLYTYQPWWIESFSPLYFAKKDAAKEAEETFMKRNSNHRHAIRVIAATHHHYNMVEGLTNQRGELKHNVSLVIVSVCTILIFIGAVLRSVTIFQNRTNYNSSWVCDYRLLVVVYGGFEVFIHLLYLIGRVDLRFYRPDVLPAKVRAIVTAEQSYFATPVASDSEEESDDNYTDSFEESSRNAKELEDFVDTVTPSETEKKNLNKKVDSHENFEFFESDTSSTASDFHF